MTTTAAAAATAAAVAAADGARVTPTGTAAVRENPTATRRGGPSASGGGSVATPSAGGGGFACVVVRPPPPAISPVSPDLSPRRRPQAKQLPAGYNSSHAVAWAQTCRRQSPIIRVLRPRIPLHPRVLYVQTDGLCMVLVRATHAFPSLPAGIRGVLAVLVDTPHDVAPASSVQAGVGNVTQP